MIFRDTKKPITAPITKTKNIKHKQIVAPT